jgi:hypothetical protein
MSPSKACVNVVKLFTMEVKDLKNISFGRPTVVAGRHHQVVTKRLIKD